MKLTPTPEQLAIIDFTQNSSANFQAVARAGAAKTTTLVMIAEAQPKASILCLAFNKKIATEMAERLPSNCESRTLNALGHRAWGSFLRKKISLNAKKNYELLTASTKLIEEQEEKEEAAELFAETLAAINQGKNLGWVPERCKGYWKPLLKDEDFFSSLEFEPTDLQRALIIAVSEASMRKALKGEIDFSDQILLPAICPVDFPVYDIVMVDEAQDLSHLNHVTLSKLVKRKRLIAVGDPCQAIYGFRGADEDSMTNLKARFNMDEFHLTTCFRCSTSVVENASWRAPDMQSYEGAPTGSVTFHTEWAPADIPDEAAILCRNNAPLFRLAIKLIAAKRLPNIGGRDVISPIVKVMRKLGRKTLSREGATRKLATWKANELERSRFKSSVEDKAECIQLFLDETETLGKAIEYIETLAVQQGRIHLLTGHKAKGLEFNDVFLLEISLCNLKEGQDKNVRYVMETRAKLNLSYINTKDMV